MGPIFFLQPGYAHYRKKLFSLLSQRHNIIFVYKHSENTYPGKVDPGGIRHHFLDKSRVPSWLKLFVILTIEKPNIIITSVSTSMQSIVAYLYVLIFQKKLILWIEEWKVPDTHRGYFRELLKKIRLIVGRRIILGSDALVVGGEASYRYAIANGKSSRDIFQSMQCSEDLAQGVKKDGRLFNPKYIFLYLGRIIDLKGLDLLIKAFAKLEKKRDDISLLIAGDGPFKNYCLKLAEDLKIKDVQFIGSIEPSKVGQVYFKADVFVLPSYCPNNTYEGWGLVINEAMSCSLPIIATTGVGAAYDLIENGINGFVVEEGSVDALYQAMADILYCDLKNMGQHSRELYEQKNNFEAMADGFTNAIKHILTN